MYKSILNTFCMALLVYTAGGSVHTTYADDTDIYLNPATPDPENLPLVMFTLDYRANMDSVSCNVGSITDQDADTDVDDDDAELQIQGSCGYSSDFSAALVEDGAVNNTKITLFEVIRAALRLTLSQVSGIKIGLMMPHEQVNSCEGGGTSPNSGCSNGAMVLMGFQALDDDPLTVGVNEEEVNRTAFLDKLRNIPATDDVSGFPDYHPYQLKEMYFEFYRYLTGLGIYNGHTGFRDFDDSNSAKGTNLDGPEAMPAAVQTDSGFTNYPSWDSSIESGANYLSPLDGITNCAKLFAINIGFGTANQDNDSDGALECSGTGCMGPNVLTSNNEQADVIRFMNNLDLADDTTGGPAQDASGTPIILEGTQNVVSYFIMASANNTQDDWAEAGGTGNAIELGSDPDVIVTTLTNIFASILSVSTTFVAPSVPVNVFNRSQTVDEVFLALFEADENGLPRWSGNLKKLGIGEDAGGDPELQDATGASAIDIDGRVRRSALTIWTDDMVDVGSGDNAEAAMDGDVDDANDAVDGRAIERGGAGQKMPGFINGGPGTANGVGNRNLFTEFDSGSSFIGTDPDSDGLIPLDVTTDTAKELWTVITEDIAVESSGIPVADGPSVDSGADTATTVRSTTYDASHTAAQTRVENILKFVRGLEDDGTTIRPWWMGDPLHSRPLTINYGARGSYTDDNPDIRLFAGTNQGVFSMFKNTEPGSAPATESGEEAWGFMPREVMDKLDTLKENLGQTDPPHPILADGTATALILDNDSDGTIETPDQDGNNDRIDIFFGMRRGGKCYYSMNVTDPDNPVFNWKICKGDTGFEELAQTWSEPNTGEMSIDFGSGAVTTDVVIFGGGYNGDDDGDNVDDGDGTGLGKDQANRDTNNGLTPSLGTDDEITASGVHEGNAIFIVKASDGSLVWKATGDNTGSNTATRLKEADMLDSIPAEVAAVDTDGNGTLDRMYTGDTGGKVWRIDMASSDRTSWTSNVLLNAGRHYSGDNNDSGSATDDCTANTTKACDRRFFNRVDVVQTVDSTGNFDAVLIGSGDREDPNGESVNNFFYMIKDRGTASGTPTTTNLKHEDLADVTDNCLQSDTEANCGISLSNGWRLGLTDSGEKNLAAPLTLGGVVFFSSFTPGGSSTCGVSEGSGKAFAVSLLDATAVFNYDTSNDGTEETYERFDALEAGGIPVEAVPLGDDYLLIMGQAGGSEIQQTGAKTYWKTYWYETQ